LTYYLSFKYLFFLFFNQLADVFLSLPYSCSSRQIQSFMKEWILIMTSARLEVE
jgi:hypothetical protein